MNCSFLYLVGQLRPGGLERQLVCLLQSMDRDRYKPVVAAWNYNESEHRAREILALGVPIIPVGGSHSPGGKLLAFGRLVNKLQPAVIHSYSFYTNFATWWVSRFSKSIPIGCIRSDFVWGRNEVGPWLGRLSARWPREQISNNWVAAQSVALSRGPFVPRRLHVVRNGVDLDRFHCCPCPANGPARILGVGSLIPVKRWDRLIALAKHLKEKGKEFRVKIAGDGSLMEPLQQMARDLKVEDLIHLQGYAEDVLRLYGESTFAVHTSDSEGCPNVVMEAMACGRAVIAMDTGDISSLVEDGKTGFVVRRGDEVGLVERAAMLVADRDLCIHMGKAARAKAEREFGLDRLVSETLAAYAVAGWKDVEPCAKSVTGSDLGVGRERWQPRSCQ